MKEEYKDLYGRPITRDQYVCSRVCTSPDHNLWCPFNPKVRTEARLKAHIRAESEAGFKAQSGLTSRPESE